MSHSADMTLPARGPAWCMNLAAAARVRPGEVVVVAADEPLASYARELVTAITELGAEAQFEQMAAAPPDELPAAMLALARRTDVHISMWCQPRPHTQAARELVEAVRGHGGRLVGLPLVTPELLEEELSQPPAELEPETRRLLAQLEATHELQLTGRAGTDLTLKLDASAWQTDGLPVEAGGLMNYPGGEVFTLPRTATGVLVADLTIPLVTHGLLTDPVTIVFEDGRAAAVEGGDEAARLRELLADAGEGADRVAEVGIGINPTLAPRGHVLIDEKIAGTAHVALGSNFHMGGDQMASIHLDCVFWVDEVLADSRPIDLPKRVL